MEKPDASRNARDTGFPEPPIVSSKARVVDQAAETRAVPMRTLGRSPRAGQPGRPGDFLTVVEVEAADPGQAQAAIALVHHRRSYPARWTGRSRRRRGGRCPGRRRAARVPSTRERISSTCSNAPAEAVSLTGGDLETRSRLASRGSRSCTSSRPAHESEAPAGSGVHARVEDQRGDAQASQRSSSSGRSPGCVRGRPDPRMPRFTR